MLEKNYYNDLECRHIQYVGQDTDAEMDEVEQLSDQTQRRR